VRVGARAKLVAVALAAAASVAACSSSGPSPRPAPSSAPAKFVDVHPLATKIRTGLSGLTSAHIAVDAGQLGGTSSGNFRYANGAATASDVLLGTGDQQVEVITVGATSYAKLPGSENSSGKPWLKVSADSSNQYVRGVADALRVANAAGSIPAVADVVDRATSAQDKGATSVDGAATHGYLIDVAPARAPDGALGALLRQLGQQSVPVQLDLDQQGRPARIAVGVRLGALTLQVTITVTNFDAPVRITAPPADQIGPG
jgi:hypothetical protein